ncbi:trypsin-like peptidase domain-containing protein [Roseovarius confluentis]|uniref:trypsin-like peptidase domain-containing protein n=1 Tax=Roseovarius confluentis TaxID=1852027 RepID=UPI003BAD1758
MNTKTVTKWPIEYDPLDDLPKGEGINFKLVDFGGSDGSEKINWVKNWEHLQGALLAIVRRDEQGAYIFGSAALVAPGVALSASHIFSDDIEELVKSEIGFYAVGIREDDIDLWNIRKINMSPDNDICVLSLFPASPLPSDRTYRQFPTIVRSPVLGEKVHLLGFSSGSASPRDGDAGINNTSVRGNLILSVGTVTEFFPFGRDRLLVPYPAFHVEAGSLGGMSGGVAITETGHLIGVISRGMSVEDQSGPTVASWAAIGLFRELEFQWPKGLFADGASLWELEQRLVVIEGRENIEPAFPKWRVV